MTIEAQTRIRDVEGMRQAFDSSFALPFVEQPEVYESVIRIRLAGDAFAIRLSEISTLVVNQKTVHLPSAITEFLGIIGFRSKIIPVYSLRAFLGYPPAPLSRFLVLNRSDDPVGFAFDEYEGQLTVRSGVTALYEGPEKRRRLISEVIPAEDKVLPLVSVHRALDAAHVAFRNCGR